MDRNWLGARVLNLDSRAVGLTVAKKRLTGFAPIPQTAGGLLMSPERIRQAGASFVVLRI